MICLYFLCGYELQMVIRLNFLDTGVGKNFSCCVKIGIVNVSERASRGEYKDIPRKAVQAWLARVLSSPWECEYAVIPDEQDLIETKLIEFADFLGCSLIVTTGGTGPTKRDVTPEATEAVCEKLMPGFGELMRHTSLQYVPTSILSRQTAGIRGKTLIVNLPGKAKAIGECLGAVIPAIPYCLDLIGGGRMEVHESEMKIFRPQKNKSSFVLHGVTMQKLGSCQ